MDQNHPIPQEISSYQFRLVGDMTLKQFFQLASGLLAGLVVYSTGLHPFIKWPIILVFVLLGVGLAFFPLEERPLAHWIIGFFKSIYSPTEFYWEKQGKEYSFFQPEQVARTDQNALVSSTQAQPAQMTESLKSPNTFAAKMDALESNFLQRMSGLFAGSTSVKPNQQTIATNQSPPVKTAMTIPVQQPSIATRGFRPQIVVEEKSQETTLADPKVVYQETQIKPTVVESLSPTQEGMDAQFSLDSAPPMSPTTPNTISGQVLDDEGKIVEGAILEIKDIAGRPVRALKSNKLGHFIIVTSLANGSYQIVTEKDGLEFDHLNFEATGTTISPIAIKAKRKIVQ